MRLKDKVCIVTGVGAGIGEAIAIRFAEEGAHLVLNDIHEGGARKTLSQVQALGAKAVLAVADISSEEQAKTIASRAETEFGRLDVLVNNAADFTQMGIEAASSQDWERVLRVNVIGTAMVTKYAVPLLKAKGGAIVNIGSMSGVIAQPDFVTYNSSKAAILTMTRCLALDLAPFGIRANCVSPGCILTSASYREIERMGMTFEQWRDMVAPAHILGRLGEPREVANAALFLASDEASFITGANLMVDGGYTAR